VTPKIPKLSKKSSFSVSNKTSAQLKWAQAAVKSIAHFSLTPLALSAAQLAFSQTVPTSPTLPSVTVTGTEDRASVAKRSTTATKTDTALIDTPQSISVITKEQIRDQAAQSVAEALRYVPGVGFAQGEGNRETPIFRGVSTTADFFVDGVRDDVQYYRDLYNIERVEVFRGPNAMIFGRGATGGLLNRVSKTPDWKPAASGSLTLGSGSNKRITTDLNQPINDDFAFRLNALYEDSGSYRDGVSLKRRGINPTLAWRVSSRTLATFGYEYFKDDRIADRGVPSFNGRPVDTSLGTFFGNAAASPTGTSLNAMTAAIEHEFGGGLTLRNRTRWSDQDKFYQNVYPGATDATGTTVALSAYNNATQRKGFFNQTDLTYALQTGSVRHTLLAGAEFSRQDTDNFRNTGYFPGGVTSVNVPISNPVSLLPVTFRQSATDANNTGRAKVAAFYLQDQLELSPSFQVIAGLRYDQFKVDFTNNRDGQQLSPSDSLVSPRLGLIYKPLKDMSVYANYSVAYLPRSGDQLSSLSATNASLAPEKFKNYELGVKWDLRANLSATAAVFRLDRANVVVLDPTDPTNIRTILSNGQRVQGLELTLAGNITPAWSTTGGYAYTDAKFVADTTATLRTGASIAQVPKHTLSWWNRYDFTPAWAAAVGVIYRTNMFAANELIPTALTPVPNVLLPGYTRVDTAVYYKLDTKTNLQLNVENLLNKKYFLNANSNNNITPGSPRALRVSLNKAF
jgi:catecholate siderophore receptor